MALSVTSQLDRKFHVLAVTGNLTSGPDLTRLQRAARRALESGTADGLILDLSGTPQADSAGLGELTVIYSLCVRNGFTLILKGVSDQLRRMLASTHLDALLFSDPYTD
jgi:anti-anti-sigma factor